MADEDKNGATGPLSGLKVVEIAGIGPGPHACTILADLGADVVRLERPQGGAVSSGPTDLLTRGRPSVGIDLKHPEAAGLVLDLVAGADVLVEGMRPGTTERLGIGPDACWGRNPALVYGRMTGWGQDGPLAPYAGHDLNYVALTGALHGLGQDAERPHFPMNLLGDFGGGSTYLVIGVLAALLEAKVSGRGQVVDAAITDGTSHLNAMTLGFLAGGGHVERRASNVLDGGQPYYDLYATADGRHMSVGPLEPKFYDEFCVLLGITDEAPDRWDPARAEELRRLVAGRFAQRSMADWTAVFEGTDACVAPVLTMAEAAQHPHNVARGTLVERDGILQPGPAPRFSRTAPTLTTGPSSPGSGARDALTAWGVADLEGLLERGVVTQT